jgi:membrane protease YdiL (CAAX protease family)
VSVQHTLDRPAAIRRRDRRPVVTGLVRRHPLASFFVLAYALSWSASLTYLITGSGPTIVSCGPALAAFTVLALTGGKLGVKGLLRSMLHWRVPLRWWAVAALTPLVLSGLATALNLAFGAATPSSADVANWTNVLPTALIILLVPAIGGAWEEPGWRGFALPRLLADRSPLAASLVLGVLWASGTCLSTSPATSTGRISCSSSSARSSSRGSSRERAEACSSRWSSTR